MTEASVAARVTTRARHRRQVRAGVGAVAAALLLVVGIAVANRGGNSGETLRVAGSPTTSPEAPNDCGSGAPDGTPTVPVPNEVAFESAESLISGDLFTPEQAHAVLAGKPLMVTESQASYLKGHGLDPSHTTTTTTVAPPPLKPRQTPFEAWADALREAGLLTPEQEAQIKAGHGITLTPEESALFEEKSGGGNPQSLLRTQISAYIALSEALQRGHGAAPDQAAPPQSSRPCPTTDTSAPPLSPRCPPERSIAEGSMEPWLDKQPDGSFVLSDDGARLLDIMGILRSAQRRTIADGTPISIKSLDGEQLVKLGYIDLADIDGSMKALPAFLFSDQQATDLRTFLQTLLRSCNRDKPTFSTGEPEGATSSTAPTSTTTG